MICYRVAYKLKSHDNYPAKIINLIFDQPSNNKSLASLILLTDYYRGLEVERVSKELNFNFPEKFNLISNYSKLEILRTYFNRKFIKNNKLICYYCNKPVKKYQKKNPKKLDKVTVDHKIPLVDNCDWFDESNLCVCCDECNNKKGMDTEKSFLTNNSQL